MTITMTDREIREQFPSISVANSILGIAKSLDGFKQSKSWQQYAAAFAKSLELMTAPEPALPGLDVPAGQVENVIREHAEKLASHRALVAAAETAAKYAEDSIRIESLRAMHDVIGRISTAFYAAIDEFKANRDAPEALNGYESDSEVRRFQARIRAANTLSYLWNYRTELGKAVNEDGVMADGYLWCMLGQPEPDTAGSVLADWIDVTGSAYELGHMAPVALWALFIDREMPLSIAALGAVEARREDWRLIRGRITGRPQLTGIGEQNRREELGLPVAAA